MASGDTLCVFTPLHNQPPSSNYAQLDAVNNNPCLAFDPTTNWDGVFGTVLPRNYAGGGVTITLIFAMTSATSGNVRWLTAVERLQDGTDTIASDSFATAITGSSVAVPGTAGIVKYTTLAHTSGSQMDSLAVGEAFRLKVTRDNTVSSNATGNARLLRCEVRET